MRPLILILPLMACTPAPYIGLGDTPVSRIEVDGIGLLVQQDPRDASKWAASLDLSSDPNVDPATQMVVARKAVTSVSGCDVIALERQSFAAFGIVDC